MNISRITYTLDQDMLDITDAVNKLELEVNTALYTVSGFTCKESSVNSIIIAPVNKTVIRVGWLPAVLDFTLNDSSVDIYRISTSDTFDVLASNFSLSGNHLMCTITNAGVYYVDCRKINDPFKTYYTYPVEVSNISDIFYITDISLVGGELFVDNDGQHVGLNISKLTVANNATNHIDTIFINVYTDPNFTFRIKSLTIPWSNRDLITFYMDVSIKVFFVTAQASGLVGGVIADSAITKASFNIF